MAPRDGYTYRDAEARYLHDAQYHACVDSMVQMIRSMLLTPGEMRDAAMLAAIIWEGSRELRPIDVTPPSSADSQRKRGLLGG